MRRRIWLAEAESVIRELHERGGGRPRVVVECVGCQARRSVTPGEVPDGEMPMCSRCLLPMVAKEAIIDA